MKEEEKPLPFASFRLHTSSFALRQAPLISIIARLFNFVSPAKQKRAAKQAPQNGRTRVEAYPKQAFAFGTANKVECRAESVVG